MGNTEDSRRLDAEREKAIARLEAGFMVPEVYRTAYWTVQANHGETHIVPADVADPREAGEVLAVLTPYVEGRIDIDDAGNGIAVRERGWLARLSAPGYLDCSPWSAHESEAAAYDYLIEMYDDGGDGEDTDDGA